MQKNNAARPARREFKRPAVTQAHKDAIARMEQDRKAALRSLPPAWAEIPVGSAEEPCVMGRTGLLLTHATVRYLNTPRSKGPVIPVKPVVVEAAKQEAPAPVPHYSREIADFRRHQAWLRRAEFLKGEAQRKSMEDSLLWSQSLQAKLTAKKKVMAKIGLIPSAKHHVPDEMKRNGVCLSFEVETALRKAEHVIAEEGAVVILSDKAKADPTSPWARMYSAPNIRDIVNEVVNEVTREMERRKAEFNEWMDGLVRQAKREIKDDSLPRPVVTVDADEVEDRLLTQADYALFKAQWKAPRISGSRSGSKPVHKGGEKIVTKKDEGKVVAPKLRPAAPAKPVTNLFESKDSGIRRRAW